MLFLFLNARAPAPRALGPLLIPHAPQPGYAAESRQDEHISVRAMRYRVWLLDALGQGVSPTDQLRLRVRPQRRPYTLVVVQHVQENVLNISLLYLSPRAESGPRLPRLAWPPTTHAPHSRAKMHVVFAFV